MSDAARASTAASRRVPAGTRKLPPPFFPGRAGAHDYSTPAIPNDPACLVTDWLPSWPGTGGAGGQLDGATLDVGWPPPPGTGGSAGGLDAGIDVHGGQDAAVDAWPGTGGSGGAADVPAAPPDVAIDVMVDVRGPAPLDGAADAPRAPPLDAADAPNAPPIDDAAADVPNTSPVDGGSDGPPLSTSDSADDVPTSIDVSLDTAPPDAPAPVDTGSEANPEVPAVDS